jgi:hypothetical protein
VSTDRSMTRRENLFFCAALCALALYSSKVFAAECVTPAALSTCFDADSLWLPAAPTPFSTIPSSTALRVRTFSVGLGLVYLSRPVTLKAFAPDPSGRTVLVVDDVLGASFAGAFAPVRHLELGIVVPMDLYRTGTGLSGVTSQRGSSLAAAALRDVRIGAGYDIAGGPSASKEPHFSAMTRLELALPVGNDEAFAGDRSPVVAPGVTLGFTYDRLLVGAQEGARFRSASDFGGARIGSQFVSSLGAAVEVISDGLLSLSAEAWVMPNFLSTSRTLPDGVRVTSGALVPAEWMATASSHLSDWTLGLGGGTAIPLSHETRQAADGTETTDHFAGVTTPRFRFLLTARYSSR